MSEMYLVDEREFFAPVASDLIDGLMGQYGAKKRDIEKIADFIQSDISSSLHYFIDGNKGREQYIPSALTLFGKTGALAALNAAYWSKAMSLTDVFNCMPQKRRDEWHALIREMKAPEFEENAVRSTIDDLLASRHKFLAERVDGIFRSLSKEHITNRPEGFNKRMIIAGVTNEYSYSSYRECGVINDLRCVVAKFMGRDEPHFSVSEKVVKIARKNHGEWMLVDGGAMRIRVYKKGTAHLEIHPDIAWRLNQILHFLYPLAIPSEFRTKPAKKQKEFVMMGRPLPFAVLALLSDVERAQSYAKGPRGEAIWTPIEHAIKFRYISDKTIAFEEAQRVLASIGGVLQKEGHWQFDYQPKDAINEIVCSGCLPDQKSHQYYPTPENVAKAAMDMAGIEDHHTCLEPSAGQGGLAQFMPQERTTCIEISELYCAILKAKGFNAIQSDFLQWHGPQFDIIVMNPPFSSGRAEAHVKKAASLLKENGRLVAILPASFKGKDVLPGCSLEWSDCYANEFAGTSVSVVIMCATKS